jgi:hypothetical protein
MSRKCRATVLSRRPSLYRFVSFTSSPKKWADILCASSTTTRSQSVCSSRAWTSSLRASWSRRQMMRCFSPKGLPERDASIVSRVTSSNSRPSLSASSSCHCSTRLPGATIRQRKQEAQRLAWEHVAVHRADLVRKRLEVRGVDGEIGVEEVGKPDTERLGDEPEEPPVGVEGPCAPMLFELETRLVAPVQKLMSGAAFVVAVGKGQRLRPVPLDADDGDGPVGEHALDTRAESQALELHHA